MRQTVRHPKAFSYAEVDRMLRRLERDPSRVRDRTIVGLALGTGLRVGSIVGLNVGDLKNRRGVRAIFEIRPEILKNGRRLNMSHTVHLPERLQRRMRAYLKWKSEQGEPLTPDAPLFCSNGGGRSAAQKGSRLGDQPPSIGPSVMAIRWV